MYREAKQKQPEAVKKVLLCKVRRINAITEFEFEW